MTRMLLGIVGLAVLGPAAWAQPVRDIDFDAVKITVHPVRGNIYYLEGSGGNIGLLVGDDGVVMVDAQYAPLTEKIVRAIRTVSDQPIRFLINTHVHDDHTSGNENFGAMGTTILARAKVRVRMMEGIRGSSPWPKIALPVITFKEPVTLHLDGEEIRVIPVPPAHTDGDSYIYFATSDVLHMGDVFRTNGYPGIDGPNGGTLQGTLDALQIAIDLAGPNTKILSGHGVISTRDDVIAFRDMVLEVKARVTKLVRQGMTLEEVEAAKPTADLDARWGPRLDRFMPALYDGVKQDL